MTSFLKTSIAAALCVLYLGTVQAAPVFTCENTVADFGTIDQTEAITRTFTVTNTGDEPLVIRKIRNTCGACMTTHAEPMELPPGEQGTITATVKLNGLNGPVRKFFYVETNVSEKSTVRFTVSGTVKAEYSLTPTGKFMIRHCTAGYPGDWELEFSLDEGRAFAITAIEAPPGFEITADPDVRAEKHKVTVHTDGKALSPGVVIGTVVIRTDDPEKPAVNVPFLARVEGPIMAYPPSLLLFLSEAAAVDAPPPFRQQVRLRSVSGAEFHITSITSSLPEVSVQQVDQQQGPLTVEVTLQKALAEGTRGEVTIRTDFPMASTVVVPFTVVSRRTNSSEAEPSVHAASKPVIGNRQALADRIEQVVLAEYGRPQQRSGSMAEGARQVTAWLSAKYEGSHNPNASPPEGSAGRLQAVRSAWDRSRLSHRFKTDPAFADTCRRMLSALSDQDPAQGKEGKK